MPNIVTPSSSASARSCWRLTSPSRMVPASFTPRPATAPRTTKLVANISCRRSSPVDAAGKYTDEAPEWLRGKNVFAANPLVIDQLRDSGHLYHDLSFAHSYPHCWRCKKPVIFRRPNNGSLASTVTISRPDVKGDQRRDVVARLGSSPLRPWYRFAPIGASAASAVGRADSGVWL